MSLTARLAPLARTLIAQEGATATFTRTIASPYDSISNTQAPPESTSWIATAMLVSNKEGTDATVSLQGTAQRMTKRTLLVAGLGITYPQAGDAVTFAGLSYTVADVERVADTDGVTVPLLRVQVMA